MYVMLDGIVSVPVKALDKDKSPAQVRILVQGAVVGYPIQMERTEKTLQLPGKITLPNGEIAMRLLLLELAGEYDKIYDPATGEYGVDVVEIPGSAILASALKEDSTVENLGEIAGETYGNLSYLSVADWMPADLLHK